MCHVIIDSSTVAREYFSRLTPPPALPLILHFQKGINKVTDIKKCYQRTKLVGFTLSGAGVVSTLNVRTSFMPKLIADGKV